MKNIREAFRRILAFAGLVATLSVSAPSSADVIYSYSASCNGDLPCNGLSDSIVVNLILEDRFNPKKGISEDETTKRGAFKYIEIYFPIPPTAQDYLLGFGGCGSIPGCTFNIETSALPRKIGDSCSDCFVNFDASIPFGISLVSSYDFTFSSSWSGTTIERFGSFDFTRNWTGMDGSWTRIRRASVPEPNTLSLLILWILIYGVGMNGRKFLQVRYPLHT